MGTSPGQDASRTGVTVAGAWRRDVVSGAGLPYRIFLWQPPGTPPVGGWPVTYLLDGNAVFVTAVEAARLVREGFGPKRAGPGAVVAIGYPGEGPFDTTRRTRDLTPPGAGEPPPRHDGRPWPPSGGAEAFLDLIEGVVKPLVAAEMPVDPARACLFGHSFGGLLALHCLFTRPDAFGTYVAASPSIWWNRRTILSSEELFRARREPGTKSRLLVTVGGDEAAPAGPPSDDPHTRRLREARMVENAREMAGRLADVPGLAVHFHLFAGENHGSVIPASVARGLRFAADENEDER